ncbi:MAG TPA: VOC family protein [Xanthobacteraceae bacterium]|nr:VOC family protein [Xanthobacteraceae bacterium]
MSRGIDHVIHLVRDLDQAAGFYESLGFLVGGRNKHPFGTHNRIVQLDGSYIELLEVAEPEKIKGEGSPNSFAHYHRDFLARNGEGLSGLVLASSDANADQASFDRAGFGGFPVFDFGRMGKRPDGREVELSFSLAYLREPASQDVMTLVCQHKRPENFWFKELQAHKNGVSRVAAAIFTADSPTDHQYFLQAWTGVRDPRSTSLGVTAETARGVVQITEPTPFADAFGVATAATPGLRFSAIVFDGDHGKIRAAISRSGMAAQERLGRLVIHAHGAVLAFEAGARG